MLTQEAIQELSKAHGIEQARESAAMALSVMNGTLALPAGFTVHDLESRLQYRRRPRGTMTTSSLGAFGDYVKAHAEEGATVFVDQDSMTASAVLNLGNPDQPGHADNIAKLAPKKTAAYLALLAIASGQPKAQTDVAEFIEDWQDSIACVPPSEPDSDTPPADMPARKAAAAIRRITIEAMQKMEATEGQLSATRSALESVKANSGGNPLPAFIRMTCAPYSGFNERTFTCRVSVLTGDKAPKLVLRIAQAEKHAEEMANELALLVAGVVALDKAPCLLGQYKPAA